MEVLEAEWILARDSLVIDHAPCESILFWSSLACWTRISRIRTLPCLLDPHILLP